MKNVDKLIRQLAQYQDQGKQGILEMFQTATDPLTQADWQSILRAIEQGGVRLSTESQLLPTPW